MAVIDLDARSTLMGVVYMPPERLFELAVSLARSQPTWQVRVTTGPQSEGPIVLDGRMLARDGVELF